MTRDEALLHLTVAYGHHPAVADFNIVAVNHVLDSLIQAEREACAKEIENYALGYAEPTWAFKLTSIIRARGQS